MKQNWATFLTCSGVLNCNYARLPIVMSKLDKRLYEGAEGQYEGKHTTHTMKR